jgi:hypothetical protein
MPAGNEQAALSKPFVALNRKIASFREESETLAHVRDVLLPCLGDDR